MIADEKTVNAWSFLQREGMYMNSKIAQSVMCILKTSVHCLT